MPSIVDSATKASRQLVGKDMERQAKGELHVMEKGETKQGAHETEELRQEFSHELT